MAVELEEEVKIFLVEAHENLDRVEQDLVNLENDPRNVELLQSVFRAVHTIKGNAGFLGYQKLERLCHRGESLLDLLRNQKMLLTPEVITLLLRVVDVLRTLLNTIEVHGEEDDSVDVEPLVEGLSQLTQRPGSSV